MVAPRGANANGIKLEGASRVFVEGKEVAGVEEGGGGAPVWHLCG